MDLQQRITAFTKLGEFIHQVLENDVNKIENEPANELLIDGLKHQIKLAQKHNGWFTHENIVISLERWSKLLTYNNISEWLSKYHFNTNNPKKVAIIMAGNVPLVGFHDFLCVLISGHEVMVKQSSNDKHLLPYLAKILEHIEPLFKSKIRFTDEKLTNFDAVIATGSNNTTRYFEYYFKGKPSIIRKNRNSVAILTGKESDDELKALSEDVFRYYGLGCRNVSKLFVPKNYQFDSFFNGVYHWHPIIHQHKYANNYDYNKAVYLMSEFDLIENGFLMLKEDESFSSPIATLFYEYYNDVDSLKTHLQQHENMLQCVVSNRVVEHSVAFGNTQYPQLWNYADNVDTIAFLLKI